MQNLIYEKLRNFVKEHHGFGGKDFEDHPDILNEYNSTMNQIRQYENKRVKIKYVLSQDLLTTSGEKQGRIKLDKDNIKFYEGKRRTKHYFLDAGLFDGWYATLIPLSIEEI